MQTWFECKVKYVKIDDDGRERKVSEVYLIILKNRISLKYIRTKMANGGIKLK
jgi:hypothetical protein